MTDLMPPDPTEDDGPWRPDGDRWDTYRVGAVREREAWEIAHPVHGVEPSSWFGWGNLSGWTLMYARQVDPS